MASDDAYSAVAEKQLDDLEASDPDLYDACVDACELIFVAPGVAQDRSTGIQTAQGIRFRLAVAGHPPHKVFWSHSEEGPRIEAVFPHP